MGALEADSRFEAIAQRIDAGSRLLRVWSLEGGVSAQVTGLEIEQEDGQVKKLLMRQHGEVDLKANPQIARDEFRLLRLLRTAGLAVPQPYYLDQTGELFSNPYIVIEYIEGATEFAPTNLSDFMLQLATHLAWIHSVEATELDLAFLPEQTKHVTKRLSTRPATLNESLAEGRIRAALEAAWPLAQKNRSTLLHGDYWPGNVLWKDGQLAAIIDWEDACLGDPLADVANCRLEILWAFGIEAMQHFTRQYQALLPAIDFSNLPYWDLYAALRPINQISQWGLDAAKERTTRERHQWFVSQALS